MNGRNQHKVVEYCCPPIKNKIQFKKYTVTKKMKMIRDTFRKTGKATSVFFNLFFFFLKVILLQMLTRREQDDGYVTLNAGKSQLTMFPELSSKSDFDTWSTFVQRDILGRFPAPPPKVSRPQSRRNVTRVALSSKPLWVALAPGLIPVLEEGKWEMGVGDGGNADTKDTESKDL